MHQIAIAVVEDNGRYLIGQRPPGVPLAGLWEFPGGKVLPGETAQQAAVRECQEETGLAVQAQFVHCIVPYSYPHGDVELHFWACRALDSGQLPKSPFRWVAASDLARYVFPPANAGLILRLTAAIRPT